MFPRSFLALYLPHPKVPIPLALKLVRKLSDSDGTLSGYLPRGEMVVPTGTLNASVPLSPFSRKELGVGFAIHPSLGKNHFSWVDINLYLGRGQFLIVWLLWGK